MPGVNLNRSPDSVFSERPAIPQRSNSFFRPRSLALPPLVIEQNRPAQAAPQARQQVSSESLLIELRDQLEDIIHKVEQAQRLLRVVHRNQENQRANE